MQNEIIDGTFGTLYMTWWLKNFNFKTKVSNMLRGLSIEYCNNESIHIWLQPIKLISLYGNCFYNMHAT